MLTKEIEKKIAKLEAQISENIRDSVAKTVDLESMRHELNRLKLQAFEEDIREQDNSQQLLKE
jgi:hypothetical protein